MQNDKHGLAINETSGLVQKNKKGKKMTKSRNEGEVRRDYGATGRRPQGRRRGDNNKSVELMASELYEQMDGLLKDETMGAEERSAFVKSHCCLLILACVGLVIICIVNVVQFEYIMPMAMSQKKKTTSASMRRLLFAAEVDDYGAGINTRHEQHQRSDEKLIAEAYNLWDLGIKLYEIGHTALHSQSRNDDGSDSGDGMKAPGDVNNVNRYGYRLLLVSDNAADNNADNVTASQSLYDWQKYDPLYHSSKSGPNKPKQQSGSGPASNSSFHSGHTSSSSSSSSSGSGTGVGSEPPLLASEYSRKKNYRLLLFVEIVYFVTVIGCPIALIVLCALFAITVRGYSSCARWNLIRRCCAIDFQRQEHEKLAAKAAKRRAVSFAFFSWL